MSIEISVPVSYVTHELCAISSIPLTLASFRAPLAPTPGWTVGRAHWRIRSLGDRQFGDRGLAGVGWDGILGRCKKNTHLLGLNRLGTFNKTDGKMCFNFKKK